MALAITGNFYVLRSGLRTRPPPQHETDWPDPITLTIIIAVADSDTFAVADTLAVAFTDPHPDTPLRLRRW
jgi:hypothetical protein